MKTLLMIVLTLSMVAIGRATRVRAQVVDTIVADVPFGFTIRDHVLPSGSYTIRRLDSQPGAMEIRDADGQRVLLFLTASAQSTKEPDRTELIFDRFGDQYFLSEIFEEANVYGVVLPKSRAERSLEKEVAVIRVSLPARNGMNAVK
jgi:hypothetical protein